MFRRHLHLFILNVDLWMRPRERNRRNWAVPGQERTSLLMTRRPPVSVSLKRTAAASARPRLLRPVPGSVVYESQDIDVEAAGGTPTLIDDSKPSNSGKKTNNPPPLISSPAAGATPPPPPSFATSPTPGAATAGNNTGTSNNTNNSVPQLF